MIIKGSLNYTASGRKRKKVVTKKLQRRKQEERVFNDRSNDSSRRDTSSKYPSASSSGSNNKNKNTKQVTEEYAQERRDISSNYTIGIAYNKGAYQVIGKDSIKDIGR